MAYIGGIITKEEQAELEKRGWEVEPLPDTLIPEREPDDADYDRTKYKMVWVDAGLIELMKLLSGPEWDSGEPT